MTTSGSVLAPASGKREPDRRGERRQDDERVEHDVEALRRQLGRCCAPALYATRRAEQPGEGDPPPRAQ